MTYPHDAPFHLSVHRYYRGSAGVLIVYNTKSHLSYEGVMTHLKDARDCTDTNTQ